VQVTEGGLVGIFLTILGGGICARGRQTYERGKRSVTGDDCIVAWLAADTSHKFWSPDRALAPKIEIPSERVIFEMLGATRRGNRRIGGFGRLH